MTEHNIRYATMADFDDVMAFGDVYMGIDYLRDRFQKFLSDSSVRSYVYLIGEEIVGFCSAFIVDDGMTLLIRASRVKAGHQGQGIYGKLTRHVYEEHKQIPSVKFEAFTTNNLNFESNKTGILKKFSLISEKAFLSYRYKSKDIVLPEEPKGEVEEMTSEDMMSLVTSKALQKGLFPGGKIIIDFVPLRLVPSNVRYMMTSETTGVFLTKDSKLRLLSIGTTVPCDLGQRYIIDVFGSDVTSLRHHVLAHLHRLKNSMEQEVVLQIVCEKELEKIADETMRSYGIVDFGFPMTQLANLERDFP